MLFSALVGDLLGSLYACRIFHHVRSLREGIYTHRQTAVGRFKSQMNQQGKPNHDDAAVEKMVSACTWREFGYELDGGWSTSDRVFIGTCWGPSGEPLRLSNFSSCWKCSLERSLTHRWSLLDASWTSATVREVCSRGAFWMNAWKSWLAAHMTTLECNLPDGSRQAGQQYTMRRKLTVVGAR